jgi:hypothetical protein
MKKQDAIKIFGTRSTHLARALGKTKQAIHLWKEDLTEDQKRMVIGEAILSGKKIPEHLLNK